MITITKEVQSSNIQSVGYGDGVLRVTFKNGAKYDCSPANEQLFHDMVSARSVGNFYFSHIKNNPAIKAVKVSG